MDKGSINGVVPGVTEVEVNISSEIFKGKVTATGLDYADVVFDVVNVFEKEIDYEVDLTGVQKGAVKIRVVNNGLDFEQSEKLFESLNRELDDKKWDAKKHYIFSFLGLICSDLTKEDIDLIYDKEIERIEQKHLDIIQMSS